MDIKYLLGKRIQEIRKSKNLTQDKLAELIGIETVSLSNIERGKYYPTSENLNKIISVLKITTEELFYTSHLLPQEELIRIMIEKLKKDENLTRLMYKFFKTIT